MKVLAAYLLAKLGGNNDPSALDLKKILASVGIEAEDGRMELLLSQANGKDLADLIASGREKMASVASAAAAPVALAGSAASDGAPAAAATTKEEQVEEKKDESEEEGGLFDLFS